MRLEAAAATNTTSTQPGRLVSDEDAAGGHGALSWCAASGAFRFPSCTRHIRGMEFSPTTQNSAAAAFAVACAPWLWWLQLRLLPKQWGLQSACAGQLVSLSSALYLLGTQLPEVTQLRDPASPCAAGLVRGLGAAQLLCAAICRRAHVRSDRLSCFRLGCIGMHANVWCAQLVLRPWLVFVPMF